MKIIALLIAISGALSTYYIAKINDYGGIKASAMTNLFFFIFASILANYFTINLPYLNGIFFGGTFVGWTSSNLHKYHHVLVSASIYFILFTLMAPYFPKHGGLLGFSAFLGVCSTLIIYKVIRLLVNKFESFK